MACTWTWVGRWSSGEESSNDLRALDVCFLIHGAGAGFLGLGYLKRLDSGPAQASEKLSHAVRRVRPDLAELLGLGGGSQNFKIQNTTFNVDEGQAATTNVCFITCFLV